MLVLSELFKLELFESDFFTALFDLCEFVCLSDKFDSECDEALELLVKLFCEL